MKSYDIKCYINKNIILELNILLTGTVHLKNTDICGWMDR